MEPLMIELKPHFFDRQSQQILHNNAFQVTAFRYSQGVCGLKIANSAGYIELLPFQGQQIWRADFSNNELVMRSQYEEPSPSTGFEDAYGGFVIHCGLTAIGNPSTEDTHEQHGELPNATYQRAYLLSGNDSYGNFISLCGEFSYQKADINYQFCPECRLYEGATTFHIIPRIQNLAPNPLEYFYLCHINFCPKDGARLVYSAAPEDIFVHHDVFDGLSKEQKHALDQYLCQLETDPRIQDTIDSASQVYDPEIVFRIAYQADDDGNAHTMQVLPDGSAYYVRHRPQELPFGIRWISRCAERDALGMVLPATAEHKGYLYCKKKGQETLLPPNESTTFHIEVGVLSKEEAAQTSQKIHKLLMSHAQ